MFNWKEAASFEGAHLAGANLARGQFPGANFTGANLEGAHLFKTNIRRANFTGVNLEGANLSHAAIEGADFRDAWIGDANFLGAFVHHEPVSFEGAIANETTVFPPRYPGGLDPGEVPPGVIFASERPPGYPTWDVPLGAH
jgi:hypothetical protein